MRVIICLFLALCLSFPAYAQEAVKDEVNTVNLTDEEALVFAGNLLRAGHLAQSKQVYALLLQSRKPEIAIEAAFQLSQIFIYEQDYDQAIQFLLAILNKHPNLARVRLELARAYFLAKDYEDARFHFELVKGGDVPPEVIQNVDRFLEAIRRQKNWSLTTGFSIIPDSNLNQASGGREECINTVWGLLCRKLDDKDSGVGVRINATANYYLRFSRNLGLRNTLGVYITEHEGHQYDDYILYAASGPRYIFKNAEISFQPTYTKRWNAGKPYSDAYGARFDAQVDKERLVVGTGFSFTKNTYNNDYVDSLLRGEEYRFYVTPRYILSNQSYVQTGLDITHDNTKFTSYGSDQLKVSLGWYYFFKYGFSIFLEGSITDVVYHDEQNYITKEGWIESIRRHDYIYGFTTELGTNLFEHYGLRPMLQYSYIRRDSNIWSREYDRHRVNLMFDLKF